MTDVYIPSPPGHTCCVVTPGNYSYANYPVGSVVQCTCGKFWLLRPSEGGEYWRQIRWYDFEARQRIADWEARLRSDWGTRYG